MHLRMDILLSTHQNYPKTWRAKGLAIALKMLRFSYAIVKGLKPLFHSISSM